MSSKPARGSYDVPSRIGEEISTTCIFLNETKNVLADKHRNKNKVSWTKLWFWMSSSSK